MTETLIQKDLTEIIARHYNDLLKSGLKDRNQSRILYQRNFNNWIKFMAIGDTLKKVRQQFGPNVSVSVLELASGKGGDMLKWMKGEISHLVCADIAASRVQQCRSLYKEITEQTQREHRRLFTAEFITADCTKQRLKFLYENPEMQFDVVSCQFAFHYCFESLAQAEEMLRNACECLKPGGYFIGTTPDSNELVKRLRSSDCMSFGNEIYRVTFQTPDKENLPLFGAKYNFQLENVVNCPEFLVYFPLLEKMAEKYNMKLLYRIPFSEFFRKHIGTSEGLGLIRRMSALEPFPPDPHVSPMSSDQLSYLHVQQYLEKLNNQLTDSVAGRQPRTTKVHFMWLSLSKDVPMRTLRFTNQKVHLPHRIEQRFSTGSRHTSWGTPTVAKWYEV